MKRFLPSGVMLFAGVLGIASATVHDEQDVTKRKKFDLREAILRKFFSDNHCPAERYAAVFVKEADSYGLDWRLLPSLSMVESGGGKHARGNNLFGWANGKAAFHNFGEAIHQVAASLAHGRSYRGKDLEGKLLAYNPVRTDYRAIVTDMMRQISPSPQVEAAE
ncbi:MAG TPA: hypothetical protein VKB79_15120 [Bryobacteraceae bacterium]|nr:hypothetical protein [Bryobacteraceae bacterium]